MTAAVAHYFCFGRWFPGADDAINEFAKELTSVPVYLEQAAELIHRGHKKLN